MHLIRKVLQMFVKISRDWRRLNMIIGQFVLSSSWPELEAKRIVSELPAIW